jgi:molybdenum cofactor biosynthesis enzyme MoaA
MKLKCYAPYIGIFYRTNNNKISPCCQYRETWDPKEYDYSVALEQINSEAEPPNCETCWERERYGKVSLRNSFEKYFKDWAEDSWDGSSFMPVYADVRTSNYCNLQCNMCSPLDSSKIEAFIKSNPEMETYFKDIAPGYQNNTVNVPVADISKLKVLKVAGGEPTIDPECTKFLDDFVASHDTSGVELWLTTNATRMLPFLRKYKPHFKRLCVTLSLDASGPVVEFIRYPCDWATIQKNIDIAIEEELCDDMNVNIVVQPYNIITFAEWAGWFSEFRERVPRTKIVFLECSNPEHFSVRAMSESARQRAAQNIETVRQQYPNLADKCDELDKIIVNKKYQELHHRTLVQYTDDISRVRGIDAWSISSEFEYLR